MCFSSTGTRYFDNGQKSSYLITRSNQNLFL